MRIISIEKINSAIFIKLDSGEHATFYKFGDTIYTTVSENVSKNDFKEFRKDIEEFKWDIKQLEEIWVKKEKEK